jgi:hypothetical protein
MANDFSTGRYSKNKSGSTSGPTARSDPVPLVHVKHVPFPVGEPNTLSYLKHVTRSPDTAFKQVLLNVDIAMELENKGCRNID